MKKALNVLGIIGSVILTIAFSVLIFLYAVLVNLKVVVSENGFSTALQNMDVEETLKTTEDGAMWEDMQDIADTLNLTEEQFEQVLNSDKVKEQIGSYIGESVSAIFNGNETAITPEEMENFLNIAIDEINKVSETEISDAEKHEIISSFNTEVLDDINESTGAIDLQQTVDPEFAAYIGFAQNALFGNYSYILLAVIILAMGLIALLRFSAYKWMPYVASSTIASAVLMLLIGLTLAFVPLNAIEILQSLKDLLVTNVFITVAILIVITVGLFVGKAYLKKYILSKQKAVPAQ